MPESIKAKRKATNMAAHRISIQMRAILSPDYQYQAMALGWEGDELHSFSAVLNAHQDPLVAPVRLGERARKVDASAK